MIATGYGASSNRQSKARWLSGRVTGLWQLLYQKDSMMTYMVMSHHMHHLPEIWDDAFDITHQATSVGGKPPTDIFRPITAKLCAGLDRNQGQRPWQPTHWYFRCTKVTGQFWNTITHVVTSSSPVGLVVRMGRKNLLLFTKTCLSLSISVNLYLTGQETSFYTC